MSKDKELNEKKTHLLILMMMAESDDSHHNFEEKFIKDVAGKMGLDTGTVDEIRQSPHLLTFSIPKTEHERMTILYHLLFLMKIDGKVNESEKALCKELGLRLGFSPLMTTELVQLMTEYSGKKIPEGKMLEIIKKYMN